MRAPILPPPSKRPVRRRKRRSWILSFLGYAFGVGVLLFLGGSAVAGFYIWKASQDLPDYESLARYEPPVMTRIHAHDGSLMAEYARERRIFVPINTIPKHVIAAYLAAEDSRFYEHGGLDPTGIARAGVKAMQNYMRRSKDRNEGASTITQQVAKNFLLSNQRTLERKIKEAILAIRIEKTYSKERILELYLNHIFLGFNFHGIAAAGLGYFSKELKDITLEEAAYLAALPKGPALFHPFKEKEKARAVERRNWILDRMAYLGYVKQDQADAAKAKPLEVNMRQFGTQIYAADYFAEEVRRTLVSQFGEDGLYGRAEFTAVGDGRVNGGLSVRTTLDPKLQRIARRALIEGLVAFDREKGWRGAVQKIDFAADPDWGAPLAAIDVPADVLPWRLGVVLQVDRAKAVVGLRPSRLADKSVVKEREGVEVYYDEIKWANRKPGKAPGAADVLAPGDVIWVAPRDPTQTNTPGAVWSLMQVPEIGGGLVAMDPHTGRVHAVVGGFSFASSQFDRALQAKRQPGSSFKPLVYAAALDNGYKPSSIVLDAPIEIDQGPGKDVWKPENYDKGKFLGPATLRTGIEKSRNQMTVRLAQDMGMPMIGEYARRFGVYDDMLPVLSMSLGAGETTVLRMATDYATLANGGKAVRATLIDRIQDRWGKTVWRHDERECTRCKLDKWQNQDEPELADDRKQILDPHTAYQMTSIMEGAVSRGTGTIIKKYVGDMPVAGKTGTTNDEKDAWFVGYTPDMVIGVFIGYDTPRAMGKGQTGGAIAAPIFGNFLKLALAEKRIAPGIFRQPPGLKTVRVNPRTGVRAAPDDREAIWEFYKPYEDPDDAYSIIGFTNETGGFTSPTDPGAAPRGLTNARGVY